VEKTVTAFEARRQFGSLLNGVDARGDKVIVTRHGEPVAAVVPMPVYEQWLRQRDELNALLDRLDDHAPAQDELTNDEAMELALEAVAAVRAEMRAERAARR